MNPNYQLSLAWFKRAVSSYNKAKIGKNNPNILLEDLCFDAQQAVEKALKSYLIFNNIEFPKTHSISKLVNILITNKIEINEIILDSSFLTEYAVETRYPGEFEPISESEYVEAIKVSGEVLNFVNSKIFTYNLFTI